MRWREDRLPRTGRAPSPRTRCARRAEDAEFEPLRTATDPRRDPRGRARRGRAGAGPLRELDRGVGAQHPRHARLRRPGVTIVGEHDFAVRANADRRARQLELERDRGRPLPPAAARPVRALPARAPARGRASQRQQHRRGGAARRRVARQPWAAIGAGGGGRALRRHDPRARGSRTRPTTSPASSGSRRRAPSRRRATAWKTSLVFAELGEDHPGALVDALREFSSREVNLTRIESRPLRPGLGRYMFFCDLEGALAEAPVAEAIEALRDARPNRSGSWAPTRPPDSTARACVEFRGQDGTRPRTQCDV